MSSLVLRIASCLAGVLVGMVWTGHASAQNAGPWPGTNFASMSPGGGVTSVPINATVLVRYTVGGGCPLSTSPDDIPRIRPSGATDPVENISASVELVSGTTFVVTPDAPLSSNTEYEVFGVHAIGEYTTFLDCDARTTMILGSFTTGSTMDTSPPTIGSSSWTCLETQYVDAGGGDAGFAENGIARLSITVSGEQLSDAVTFDIYSDPSSPTPTIDRASSSAVSIPLTGDEDHRFAIVAVDVAGNRSAQHLTDAAPTLCPEPAQSSGGCSITHTASGRKNLAALLVMFAFGLAVRRRSVLRPAHQL